MRWSIEGPTLAGSSSPLRLKRNGARCRMRRTRPAVCGQTSWHRPDLCEDVILTSPFPGSHARRLETSAPRRPRGAGSGGVLRSLDEPANDRTPTSCALSSWTPRRGIRADRALPYHEVTTGASTWMQSRRRGEPCRRCPLGPQSKHSCRSPGSQETAGHSEGDSQEIFRTRREAGIRAHRPAAMKA